MFAGKLDRKNLKGIRRASLLLFRGLEGDFRNWEEIKAWVSGMADELSARSPMVGWSVGGLFSELSDLARSSHFGEYPEVKRAVPTPALQLFSSYQPATVWRRSGQRDAENPALITTRRVQTGKGPDGSGTFDPGV